jgi:hypothetical protein
MSLQKYATPEELADNDTCYVCEFVGLACANFKRLEEITYLCPWLTAETEKMTATDISYSSFCFLKPSL